MSVGGILHVIPESVMVWTFQGSYKDTMSRADWFRSQPTPYRQVVFADDQPPAGLPPAENVHAILVEYTQFPLVLALLRTRYPGALLAVRAHNIEPLNHFDAHGCWPPRGPLWMLYGMWQRLRRDMLCKRYADVIYSISDYENRVYWSRLPGRARTLWLPYVSPRCLMPEHPLPHAQRKTIAFMAGDVKVRRSRDGATRFIRFAETLKAAGAPFEFIITGDVSASELPPTQAVKYTGMIQDLSPLLGQIRATAMLSPLGYGFKTSLGDALAAGAYGVVHPTLVRRCPPAFAPGLIPLQVEHLDRSAEIQRVLQRLEQPFPLVGINRELEMRAFAVLAADFGPSTRSGSSL